MDPQVFQIHNILAVLREGIENGIDKEQTAEKWILEPLLLLVWINCQSRVGQQIDWKGKNTDLSYIYIYL